MGDNHIITHDIRVGKNAAEDDDLLQECFIDSGAWTEILDKREYKYVLQGRSGAGKSAIIRRIREEKADKEKFLQCIFALLYRVGAIGLKIRATDKIQYSYLNDVLVEETDIRADTAIYVVKMLHSYLDIKIHG
ncbi:MAG: hypothetical protein DU429_01720 [Candidatus Tokpelaia sp.]|nr:MAG: hypothetical protein DU430_03350 [Candidatus Tokpelaia sp.]KAA6207772.1 MAG: hypothetical protein DU429_01720 [Candidatus Tokpelaia sp.]